MTLKIKSILTLMAWNVCVQKRKKIPMQFIVVFQALRPISVMLITKNVIPIVWKFGAWHELYRCTVLLKYWIFKLFFSNFASWEYRHYKLDYFKLESLFSIVRIHWKNYYHPGEILIQKNNLIFQSKNLTV